MNIAIESGGAQFERAVQNLPDVTFPALLDAYDFRRANVIIDVGGGDGSLLVNLLRMHEDACGVTFDQPACQVRARAKIRAASLVDRLHFEAGDFFARVPEGADHYILKSVLHDWDDASCIQILWNIRRAIVSNGRLIVIERTRSNDRWPGFMEFGDLNMIARTDGIERTVSEFRALLVEGGFRLARVVPTASLFSLFEAVPA
jgi:hypothetical protein